MKIYYIQYAAIICSVLLLNACQTAGQVQNAAQNGIANSYSCEQITATFAAYEADKSSLGPLLEISKMTGLELNEKAEGFDPSKYYETAKTSANVALLVQGCSPLQ